MDSQKARSKNFNWESKNCIPM